MALTSISLNDGASIAGRALARNGAVTLINNQITVPVCSTTPPTCALTAVNSGPPKSIEVTVQDPDDGIGSINISTVNATTTTTPALVPVGDTAPVIITATKVDQTMGSNLTITVTDTAGNVTVCDPALLTASRNAAKPASQTLNGVTKAESKLIVQNDANGLSNLRVTVKRKVFELAGLGNNERRTLDLSSAMDAGSTNTVVVTALGAPGSSAFVLLTE